MSLNVIRRFSILAATLIATLSVSSFAIGAAGDGLCEPFSSDSKYSDYRQRNSPQLKWAYQDNMTHHTKPAIDELRQGRFWRQVIADLNFTLTYWPNHLIALQALIEYDIGGGKRYEFRATECYFARARQLFPDDANVVLAEALWTWKKGNVESARSLYESALLINPNSAEAHYNLGLLLFRMSHYQESLDHARIAYETGYPLPGLRRMLEEAGMWEPKPDRAATPR